MGDRSRHIRDAVVEHVVDEVDGVGMSGGARGFEAAALIDRHIDNHGAALHDRDHIPPNEFGSRCAGDQHAADDEVRKPQRFRNGEPIRSERDHHAVEDVVEFAQAVEIAVDDGDVRAHAEGDSGCIGADHATSEDGYVSGRDAGHAAEQNAASAVGAFQILRTDLHGHASGDLAHRREQGQGAVALHDGFVGDAVYAIAHELIGEFGQGSQVEVGEQGQARTEILIVRGLRLFHFDDELGFSPYVRCFGQDVRAHVGIIFVEEGAALAGAGLDHNLVARFHQRSSGAGYEADSGLVIFDFSRYANNHTSMLPP